MNGTSSMKVLLLVTAVVEAATGVAMLLAPSGVVSLLLASPLETPTSVLVGRVAGAALLALGLACGLAPGDASGRAAWALVVPMLLYNVAVIKLLVYAAIGLELAGIGLWPAVLVHAALAAWCIGCLARRRAKPVPATETAPSAKLE
jgi:hypothetical protein